MMRESEEPTNVLLKIFFRQANLKTISIIFSLLGFSLLGFRNFRISEPFLIVRHACGSSPRVWYRIIAECRLEVAA